MSLTRFAAVTLAATILLFQRQAPAQAVHFGSSCAGGSGFISRVDVSAPPRAGTTFDIDVLTGIPGSLGALIIGLSNGTWAGIALPWHLSGLGLPGCYLNVSLDLPISFSTDPVGSTSFPIDATGLMPGSAAYLQALVLDAGMSRWAGLSQGLQLTIMPPLRPPFTVAMLPDTQHYSDSATRIANFEAQTNWIVINMAARNIVFTAQMGDIVQNGARGTNLNRAEWLRADRAMDILDGDLQQNPDGHIPYCAVLGNHDYDIVGNKSSSTQYITYFGPQRYQGRTWFVGASPNQVNMSQLFQADGETWLNIGLEWRPSDDVLEWAQSVLNANPEIPTIISSHEYLGTGNPAPLRTGGETPNSGGDNGAASVYAKLVEPYPQIYLVLCGHVIGDGRRSTITALGRRVHQVLADYQGDPNGGNGWMQLIEHRPQTNEIEFRTFSPTYVPGVTSGPNRAQNTASNFVLNLDLDQLRADLRSKTIVRFRQGQDNGFGSYMGTRDAYIGNGASGSTLPNSSYGSASEVRSDGDDDYEEGLLRFEGIVGTGPGQIPPGTQIDKAILTVTTEGSYAESSTGSKLHRMLVAWDESSTWNSLVNGIQLGTEARPAHDLDSAGRVSSKGTDSFDVTASVQAWVQGETNRGWAILANGTDRWAFRSSEWPQMAERPMLTVVY